MLKKFIFSKNLSRIYVALVVFILCLSHTSVHAQTFLPSGIEESKLKNEIQNSIFKNNDDGLAIAVFKDEETLFEIYNGFANLENEYMVDENTVFEWGSATKLLTWISAMQLNEAGKLDLNQDVRELLPVNFFKKLKYDEPITVLDLMNHTAGWQDNLIGVFTLPESIRPMEEYLKKYEPPQIAKPGTISSYSNWGVALTALIVERISEKPFYEYVNENIFVPLDMNHTSLAPDFSDNMWVKEQRDKIQGYFGKKLLDIPDTVIPLYPAGQATGTLRDMTKFAKAISNSSDENLLFKDKNTLNKMYEPTLLFEEYDLPRNAHGMWASNYKVSVLGHDGGTVKFFSKLIFDPESGYGCVIVTNNKNSFKDLIAIPQIMFGDFNSNPNVNLKNDENLKIDDGFYISSRSYYEIGAFKLLRLFAMEKIVKIDKDNYKSSSLMSNYDIKRNNLGIFESNTKLAMVDGEVLFTTTMGKLEDGRNIIHKDYGDTIEIPKITVFKDATMFILFIVAILYSIIVFITKITALLILGIKKLLKRNVKSKPLFAKKIGKLIFIASSLIVLLLVNIGLIGVYISTFSMEKLIAMHLFINLLLAAAMVFMAIFIFTKYRKIKPQVYGSKISIISKLNLIFITLSLIIVSTNILYWNLWKL